VPLEFVRVGCDTVCHVISVPDGPSRVIDLCGSRTTVIDSFTPQVMPTGQFGAVGLGD
jgi:hypothetical protein